MDRRDLARRLQPPPREVILRVVRAALEEDLAWGDATTDSLIPPELSCTGVLLAKAAGVVAGLPVAEAVFREVQPDIVFEAAVHDGTTVRPGDILARLQGPAAGLLRAERVALNFLQRLSGIATLTRRYVEAIQGTSARIVDTRKTTPGLRALEKYAVRAGGGQNHRFCLADGVLIKDNHIAALASAGVSLREAVARARQQTPHSLRVEVEIMRLDQIEDALAGGADALLLDNMPPPMLREAVRLVAGRALTEASGGITLETVRAVAETGVDLISVGALTHSAPALDISLELEYHA
jgi:nicotinate-nucleotide pyrophosphorylase (carboxylating)